MSILQTGSFEAFCEQWKCTPEEQNLLMLYLAVIRLHTILKDLSSFIDYRFMTDGDGI